MMQRSVALEKCTELMRGGGCGGQPVRRGVLVRTGRNCKTAAGKSYGLVALRETASGDGSDVHRAGGAGAWA